MRTLAAIHATINTENFEVIRSCTGPQEAYLKLCEHHDDAGGLPNANLFSDVVTLCMSSDGGLKDHVHQFRKLHNDLLSNLSCTSDIKISEPFVAIILINSLPSDYTPLAQSLLTNFESLTLARLYSSLNIKATQSLIGSKTYTVLSVKRFMNEKKSKKKDGYQSNKDTIYCSLGHAGHTDEHCNTKKWREFKKYQEAMQGKPNPEGSNCKPQEAAQMTQENIADQLHPGATDVSYYDTAFSAVATSLSTVFDMGASSHMFGERKAFISISRSEP